MLKKKIVTIIIGLAILLLLAIGVVYANSNEITKTLKINETIVLESNCEPIIVKLTESENRLMINKEQNQNENEKDIYYIKVNYQENTVTIYKRDDYGNYVVPYKVFVCSCGRATPTSGVYTISDKYEWRALVNNVYGQYATRIVGSILFHSVPYERIYDKASLEYWEYDKLGQTASAGCVRLRVIDAKWIYDNCESGTKVEFYASENPGPIGKTIIQKISDNEKYRNWDPTDVDVNNPWLDTNEN